MPKIGWQEGIGLVGGYLGLFIGASVITFFEFLHFLAALICQKMNRYSTEGTGGGGGGGGGGGSAETNLGSV